MSKAEELAKQLDEAPYSCGCTNEAAAELRRLDVENVNLRIALESSIDYVEQAVTDYVLTYGEKWRPARLAAMREDRDAARAALKETP